MLGGSWGSLVHVLTSAAVTDLITHMSCALFSRLLSEKRRWPLRRLHSDEPVMHFSHRDPEERLVRREKPAHPELLDLPVHADPPEMTVPRATPYVTAAVIHTEP